MKGIVFTEFLGFVAQNYGENAVDDIIEESVLPSGGAYTAVGTYPHGEMVALCTTLSQKIQEPARNLTCQFGLHLSRTFAFQYPDFFAEHGSFFDFLASVEDHIHVEVKKLYPDAELPSFRVINRTKTRMIIEYESPRRMSSLAHGLILGSAAKYGVTVEVGVSPDVGGDPNVCRFVVEIL